MKKLLSYMLLLTLTAGFAACGGGGGSLPAPNPGGGNTGGTNDVAPTITSTAPAVATEGEAYSYTATATGSGTLSFDWLGLPAWLNPNGATISGTPGASDVGTGGQINLIVSNGTLPNATQAFTINVLPASSGSTPVETAFLLTDAPVDELSVFQVEITKVDIEDTSNAVTNVFPATPGSTLVVNLLNLQGINNVLSNVALQPGTYDEIEIEFINATAVDNNANALTVLPQTSGTVKVRLRPAAVVTTASTSIQIDFDVNNSISNLITGAGGSLTLSPTIFALQQGASAPAATVRELKGTVTSVTASSMNVDSRGSTVLVSIDANTSLEDANGNIINGISDLTSHVSVNDAVEVDGSFDAATNTLNASRIEVKGATPAAANGLDARGVINAIGADSFDVIITDARKSGLSAGSTQTVTTTGTTVFSYDRPAATATFANLAIGQEVRFAGSTTSALDAARVSLRETSLIGQVATVDSALLQATMTVSSIEKLTLSVVSGFTNPVTLQFSGSIPASVTVGANLEVEGVFNRSAAGVFDVAANGVEAEAGKAEIEGKTFSVVTSSPLSLSITGEGENIPGTAPLTVTVVLDSNVVILERDKQTKVTTTITAAELEAGINQPKYRELKAEGIYDAGSNTVTATKIRADVGQPGQGGESELEGESYTVSSTSPFEFDLTGNGEDLGLTGSVTVKVVYASTVVFAQKEEATRRLSPLSQADFESGMNSNAWGEVEAKGSYDSASNTLTASFIKVETGEGVDEGKGETYSVVTSSPLSFTLELVEGNLGGTAVTTATTVTVTLAVGVEIVLRDDPNNIDEAVITEAELAAGLAAGDYDEVKIDGQYDATSNTFVAGEVRVRIK